MTVKKVIGHLETIARNDAKELYTTILVTDEPVRLSNQLREAKAFLEKISHKEYNDKYLHLACVTNYSFRMDVSVFPPRIIARLKSPKAVEESIPLFHPVSSHSAPEITDVLAAISYVILHKNIESIIFPALPAKTEELVPLQKWSEKNHYTLSLSENGVVVSKS